jgi:hypothetical protein
MDDGWLLAVKVDERVQQVILDNGPPDLVRMPPGIYFPQDGLGVREENTLPAKVLLYCLSAVIAVGSCRSCFSTSSGTCTDIIYHSRLAQEHKSRLPFAQKAAFWYNPTSLLPPLQEVRR